MASSKETALGKGPPPQLDTSLADELTTRSGDVVQSADADGIREMRSLAYRLLLFAELSEELLDDGPKVAA
jgi:hypothetical protein